MSLRGMPRRGRTRLVVGSVCATAVLGVGVNAVAQQRIVDGYALDANQRQGSGGFNDLSARGLRAPTYNVSRMTPRTAPGVGAATGGVRIDGSLYNAVGAGSSFVLNNSGNYLFRQTESFQQLGAITPRIGPSGAVRTTTFQPSRYNPLR